MVKIAVTGPHGRLGSELVRQGCTPIEANVLNYSDLYSEIKDINPDVVVHCAAYTDVNACEKSPGRASEINTGGTFALTKVFSGKIVYISTDYIFDGKNGPYDEEAKPNPIGIYGWSKLGGELVIRNRQNPDDLIIRTTVLFDKYSKNFVTSVIEKLLTGDSVSVPSNLYGSPTYIPHLAKGILNAMEVNGILNIVGGGIVSRYRFARQIANVLNISRDKVQQFLIEDCTFRPLLAGLLTNKAMNYGIKIYHPLDGVKEMVNALETMETG